MHSLAMQVLGRNLEGLVTRAQNLKSDWKDKFVSVEHLVLAFLDDTRFGQRVFQAEGLTKASLEAAIKEIRGTNQVTDQVSTCSYHSSGLLVSSHSIPVQ